MCISTQIRTYYIHACIHTYKHTVTHEGDTTAKTKHKNTKKSKTKHKNEKKSKTKHRKRPRPSIRMRKRTRDNDKKEIWDPAQEKSNMGISKQQQRPGIGERDP